MDQIDNFLNNVLNPTPKKKPDSIDSFLNSTLGPTPVATAPLPQQDVNQESFDSEGIDVLLNRTLGEPSKQITFPQIGREVERQKREMMYAASQIPIESIVAKKQAGQELTPLEKYRDQMTSGAADPNVLENPVNIALLAVGLGTPVAPVAKATLGPVLGASLGMGIEGAATNVAVDTGEALMRGRAPDLKQTALNAGLGFVVGAAGGAFAGKFSTKIKDVAQYEGTGPQQINKLLQKEAKARGLTRGEVLDEIITQHAQTPEGAAYFAKYLQEAQQPVTGTQGIKTINNLEPQIQQTTMGQVFEGQRLVGETQKGLTESGIAYQVPGVREGYLGSPFQAPGTRETIRQGLIQESSPFTRPSRTFVNDANKSPVVRSIEVQNRPMGDLIKDVADMEGTVPQAVIRQAHAEAGRTGKSVKQILSDKITSGPTVQDRIDDVIGDRVTFRGAGEAANVAAANWQRAIEDVLPENEIQGLLDDLSRPMTQRTGNTVSETGKIIPGFQAISEGDQKIANFTENLLNRLDPVLREKQDIPLDDIYRLATELPDSSLARVIASGQVNAKILNNMAVEVAALKMASKSHMIKLFGLVDDFARGGKATADDVYRELGVQMQILDSAGLTGSPAGRLLRTFGEFKAQGDYARIVTKRMQKLFGKKPDPRKMGQLVNDLRLMSPEDQMLALAKTEQAGFLDKYFFFYKNGMLSGPRTWQKNHIGNTFKLIANEIERPFQVAGDFIASGGGLLRPRERFFHESVEAFNASGNGTLTAIDTFLKRLRGGISGETAAKFDIRLGKGPRVYTNPFGEGIVGEIIGKPIQILDASDAAFKELNSEIATNTITYRYARQIAGKNKIPVDSQDFTDLLYTLRTDPTDSLLAPIGKTVEGMTKEIKEEVLESVFQSDLYRGLTEQTSPEVAQALRDMSAATRNTVKFLSDPIGTGADVITHGIRRIPVMGEIIFPFRTAPANLFRWGFERTMPYAPLISAGKILARAKAGAPLRIGEELGKNAFGALLAGGIGYLTYQGVIKGGMVPNPKRRGLAKNARSAGDVPYTIQVGDKQIPYMLFEPIGPMIAINADYVELANEYPLSSSDFWKGLAYSFGNNVTGRSYVESLGTFWDLINGDWDRAKSGLAFQTIGWTVPFSAALRTAGIATDVQRDPHTFTQEIMSHLPYLREQVPPMLDRWGEEIASPDTTYYKALKALGVEDEVILDTAQRLGVAFAPLPSFEEKKSDPANQGMLRLIERMQPHEDPIYGPPTWNKDFAIYTDKQFTAYQKLVGQREKQFFTDLVNQLGDIRYEQIIYNRTSREQFVKRINNRFTAIRKRAKAEVFGGK